MQSKTTHYQNLDLFPEKLVKDTLNKQEKRKTSAEKENQSKNIIKPVLSIERNLRSERNLTPNAKTSPKSIQQFKPVITTSKEAKPVLKVGVPTPKPTTPNQGFGRNLKKEEPAIRKPQTSASPIRTQTNRSKSPISSIATGKTIAKKAPKTLIDTTATLFDETPHYMCKTTRAKAKESTSSTDDEIGLSEKLAQFSQENLNSKRPKFVIGKSKKKDINYDLNLECLFILGKKISNLYESLIKNGSIYLSCREYIQISMTRNNENFDKLFKDENVKNALKSYFVLEKVSIIAVLYCFIEDKVDEQLKMTFKSLLQLIYQDMMIFLEHLYCRLHAEPIMKNWKENMLNVLKKEFQIEQDIFDKRDEYLERMKYNNTLIKGTIKKICSSYISRKELHYCINMIILQLEKLSVEDADKKLLDSFSLFVNEKKLKATDPLKASKIMRATLMEKEDETEAPSEDPVEPFLPSSVTHPYTLVVDLDETLVHYAEVPNKPNELRIRPYAENFLVEMAQYYEIVIFTAALKDYADWAIDNIDKNKNVSHRLYRHHASFEGNGYAKDLSKLGRDLSKVIIVDNIAENFKLQPDNGIFIKTWYDDPEDTALLELGPLLKEIASRRVKDVRRALKLFREQMMANIEKGIDDPHMHLNLDTEEVESDENNM